MFEEYVCSNADRLRNKEVYERCGVGPCANEVKCDVVEWMKRNTLRWFGPIERKNSEKFVKIVHENEFVGTSRFLSS